MKRLVRVGPLVATLTQLETGTHKGSWKITYQDKSGKTTTGGIIKEEVKAKARAKAILKGLLESDVSDLTAEESHLIRKIRDAHIAPASLDSIILEMQAVKHITTAEAVDTFLAREIDGAEYSHEQHKDYHRILADLKAQFTTQPLAVISLHQLEAWADKWKVGSKRHNNKRAILCVFWKWAASRGFAVKNIAENLPRKRLPHKKDHVVLSPKEFAILLTNCPQSHLPWLALAGFTGLRGVEIYGRPKNRRSGLHWENIDWKRKIIVLDRNSSKQTRSSRTRLIPVCDALLDWLEPWKNSSGPVYSPKLTIPCSSQADTMTMRLGRLIGGWKSNALRASRASYRLAQTQSIATVTLEMGHTKDILLGNYLNPRFEEDAKTWFSLDRKAAAMLLTEQPITSISA